MDVSIIIVNYNTKELLKNCINSVYEHTKDVEFEIIVSDNGSKDGSIEFLKEQFPNVILLENNANLGFGKANNKGLDIAKGKYIFYLNSDTVILNNSVKYFYDYFENHENENLGAIGANLLDKDLNITHSYGNFPDYKKEVRFRLKNSIKLLIKKILLLLGKSYNKKTPIPEEFYTGDVDYVTGADLFMKNNEYARFDERFFLYYEETDLQYHLSKNNLSRRIIDGPKIQHLCNALNSNTNDIQLAKSFSHIQSDKSSFIYFSKNLNPNKKSKCLLLKFAIKLTWLIVGVKNEDFV